MACELGRCALNFCTNHDALRAVDTPTSCSCSLACALCPLRLVQCSSSYMSKVTAATHLRAGRSSAPQPYQSNARAGLIVNSAIGDATNYDRGYGNHPLWLQVVSGITVLGTMIAVLIVFVIYPGAPACLESVPVMACSLCGRASAWMSFQRHLAPAASPSVHTFTAAASTYGMPYTCS